MADPFAGAFDDLIPAAQQGQPSRFDGAFDDLIPTSEGQKPAPAAQNDQDAGNPYARQLQLGAQAVGRGLADLAGAPVDLTTLGLNAALAGADALARPFGGSVDTRITDPVMGSDWIARHAGAAADAAGAPPISPEDMSPAERLRYSAERYGTAGITGAAGLTRAATTDAAASAPQAIRALTEPYLKNPATTAIGDTAAAVGAGTADASYETAVPEQYQNPLTRLLVNLIGGVGGATGASVGGALKDATLGRAVEAFRRPDAGFVDPATGRPYKTADMEMAARMAQDAAVHPAQAADNIRTNARDFRSITGGNETEMPTTAMLADDVGLSIDENSARVRNMRDYQIRDNARRALASEKLGQSVPQGADPRRMTAEMDQRYAEGLAPAQAQEQAAADALQSAERGVQNVQNRQAALQQRVAADNSRMAENRYRQGESSSDLAKAYTGERIASQDARQRAYDAVPGSTPVNPEAIQVAVNDAYPPSSQYGVMAAKGDQAGRSMIDRIQTRLTDPKSGGLRQDLTYGDVSDMIADASQTIGQEIAAGRNPAALKRVRQALTDIQNRLNPAAREAAAAHRERFKTGQSGEYNAAQKRAARYGNESSATRPSEFAGKFLRTPEGAQSLQRAIDVNGNQVNAQNVTTWMLGDMAKAGLVQDGRVRADRFAQWASENKDVLAQFPSVQKTIEAEVRRASRTGKVSQGLTRKLAQAQEQLGTAKRAVSDAASSTAQTRRDLDRSVWGTQRAQGGRTPDKTVAAIMNGGDPERQLHELSQGMRTQESKDGLKAAVKDWILNKADTTGQLQGSPEAAKLSRAALNRLMKQHDKALAAVYSPKEMQALQQARKLLDGEASLQVGASGGSNTADKLFAQMNGDAERRWRMLEGGLKARYGVLKGGGILRTLRVLASTLPSGMQGTQHIMQQMYFDPDLAAHLLTRPVKEVGTPVWNAKLGKLISAAAGGRESGESTDD